MHSYAIAELEKQIKKLELRLDEMGEWNKSVERTKAEARSNGMESYRIPFDQMLSVERQINQLKQSVKFLSENNQEDPLDKPQW